VSLDSTENLNNYLFPHTQFNENTYLNKKMPQLTTCWDNTPLSFKHSTDLSHLKYIVYQNDTYFLHVCHRVLASACHIT